ncbi:MAG: HupE/UreJ family protein [Planctomycetota bacterium]|nr:HupE/UreJ family protein [Planctomycetota bacterium]
MSKYRSVLRSGILLFFLWHVCAFAHKPSDSYLTLSVANVDSEPTVLHQATIKGQWDIALRDLDYAIGLDEDANSEINWQEVLIKQKDINAYAFARLSIRGNHVLCPITPTQTLIDHHTDGAYAVLKFTASCQTTVSNLSLRYTLFSELDPSHRGLLRLEYEGFNKTAIFGPENRLQSFVLGNVSHFGEFKEYLVDGIWHIWKGYDHILFLLSLLLPAVLVRTSKGWQPAENFKPTIIEVLKVVTAFTVAHSITLTLATLQLVALPSRWVEAAIAFSVVLAALNNVFPVVVKYRWLVAFSFGLIHGFGFSAVLADLGLRGGSLALALIGFNLGVEIGQIGILSLYVPISYAMRRTKIYKYVVFYVGSMLIVCVAGAWLVERVFNIELFSSTKGDERVDQLQVI